MTLVIITGGEKISTYVTDPSGQVIIKKLPAVFSMIDSRVFGGNLSIVSLIFFGCVAATWILPARHKWGRELYSIGGNEEAARLSGVSVRLSKFLAYSFSGLMCAVAGMCQAAQEAQGDPEAGAGYELTAIAMVVIGGTSLAGGRGSMGLTLLGILTIGYLEKILSINAVPEAARSTERKEVRSQEKWFGFSSSFLSDRSQIYVTRKGNMKRRSLTVLFFAALVGFAAMPLFANGGQEKGQAKAAGQPKWVIGMSQCNLGEPWRVQMNADIKAEADKHPEIKMVFKDAQNDTLKRRAHVEEFVSAGVNLLIISPKEAQPLAEPVAMAMEAGIPVIVLDRDIVGERHTEFIGADNVKIGKAVGTWLVDKYGGKKASVVELMGLQTSTPGQDRHKGFVDAIARSDLNVIFQADCKWLEPDARTEMESALARFNTINIVYGHNDPSAHGAYLAAKAVGREKDIVFVGIDSLPQEGVAYVKQGILNATFQYPTGGDVAIRQAIKMLDKEQVPKRITLGSRMFTQDKVDQGGVPIE